MKYLKLFEELEGPLEIKKMQLDIIKKYPEAHKIRMSHQRDFWKIVLDENKETKWKPSEDEAWKEAYNEFIIK